MLQAPTTSSPSASSGLAALAAHAIDLDPRSKAELHFDRCFPYLLSIGCFNGSRSLETFILEGYLQQSIKAYWFELMRLTLKKEKVASDTRRIAAWLAEYSSSKAKDLEKRLKRLWQSAKPICELCRKQTAGSAEKLRQRLEEEQPMECAKVGSLISVDRELLLTHKRLTMRSQCLRELVDTTRLLEEETQIHTTQASAGDAQPRTFYVLQTQRGAVYSSCSAWCCLVQQHGLQPVLSMLKHGQSVRVCANASYTQSLPLRSQTWFRPWLCDARGSNSKH